MALLNKIRRDTKKSSYYVWFLGAQESKGLRGAEYITPVLKSLIEREKTVEPFKITLQVSHKGLKIIQNLSNINSKPFSAKGDGKPEQKPNKNDVIKHFIPHHAVTCVLQEDDVVACILLLYNPVTRCPVHVHGYRCDSKETATLLTNQLTTLILRPDNQKKMNEIEGRLRAKGLLLPTVPRVNIPKRVNSSGSEGRSTTSPASESSGGSSGGGCQNERITNLYDSLAAELREKLGMGTDSKSIHAPILLPPRDYDTVHRQKGNLTGIEMRRCLNENIVGIKNKKEGIKESEKKNLKGGPLGRILESSGGSSGIGSDHPPSPDQNGRYLDNQSTSDEEWVEHPSEDSLFLMAQEGRNSSNSWRNTPEQMSLPRAKRQGNNRMDSPSDMDHDERDSPNRTDSGFHRSEDSSLRKRSSSPRFQKKEELSHKRSESPKDYRRSSDENFLRKRNSSPHRNSNRQSSPVNIRASGRHPNSDMYRRSYSPTGRLSRKEVDEPLVKMSSKNMEESIPREKSSISIENFRKRNEKGNMSPVGVVAPRRRTSEESRSKMDDQFWDEDDSYKRRIPGYKDKLKQMEDSFVKSEEFNQAIKKNEENHKMSAKEKKLRENTMKLSPQERFLDAKTKFLMLEKERLKEQDKNAQNLEKKRSFQDEAPISPEIIRNRPSWGRREESQSLKNQKANLVRRNSFFELDSPDDKYYEKEQRGKIDQSKDGIHDQEPRIKRLSRSDSRNRFFSQERLNGDLDYEVRYRSDSPKKYREDHESPRRIKTSREERHYPEESRRRSRGEYSDDRDRERGKFVSPSRDIKRYSSPNGRRRTSSDDENYPDDDDYRYEMRKRYEKERSYSNGRETPPRTRAEEEENFRRRKFDEDDLPFHFKGSNKGRMMGREEMPSKAVPYEKSKKSKYEMLENEKKMSSNALAKEFKRRSYQDKFDKMESDKRKSYGDRDFDDRYCEDYPEDMGYPEKSEVQRRNQYNLASMEFKRNSHELAKEFNRRSRGYSYESEDDSRRQRSSLGYPEPKEKNRYPGYERESERHRRGSDDGYAEPRISRMNSDDHEKFVEVPRMSHIQMDKMPARYRHSFVDSPQGLSVMPTPRGHEMLHRTNSSVSSNRVGIAAVHPY